MKRALLILALAVGMASCGGPAGASGAASGTGWLQGVRPSEWNSPHGVGKYCDTETGNLVYLYGDPRGGIAVVPGGCK